MLKGEKTTVRKKTVKESKAAEEWAKALKKYQEYVKKRLGDLSPILQNVAIGDFSKNVNIPEKEDEFTELLIALDLMIDDLRELKKAQAESQKNLEKKVEERTKELNEKISELENNESATLNIMEDLQETVASLKITEDDLRGKNKELASIQEELRTLNEGLEQKIKERTAEIEKLLKQKDEFVNQLGHDLKSPLTPLITLLPIIQKRQEDQKSKELLDVSIKNVQYMQNLVVKTVQLARLNAPSTQLDIEDTNLLEELNKVIDNNQFLFKENKITIENKIREDIIVKADKLRLDELFNNLITNAVKYISDIGILTIDAQKDRDFVIISFKDTGMGLTKEQIDNIFDEFYKVDSSRHDLESSGLGLPICKRIVEKHGGKIWVESPGVGKGSTFYFTLKKSGSKKV